MRLCFIPPLSSRLKTSSSVISLTSMSSVRSRCCPSVRFTPVARKQWQMLFMVLVLADTAISSLHFPPLYPVSSSSSRRAASSGRSPSSHTPATISVPVSPSPWRYCLIITYSPCSVVAMTLTHAVLQHVVFVVHHPVGQPYRVAACRQPRAAYEILAAQDVPFHVFFHIPAVMILFCYDLTERLCWLLSGLCVRHCLSARFFCFLSAFFEKYTFVLSEDGFTGVILSVILQSWKTV